MNIHPLDIEKKLWLDLDPLICHDRLIEARILAAAHSPLGQGPWHQRGGLQTRS